jgi:hypothetical protein
VVGCCEHGNEPSGTTKEGEFLDHMRNNKLFKKGCSMGLGREGMD